MNRFFGPIPQDLKDKFPALQTLDIAANLFNGTVPSSIFSIKNLTVVDLSRLFRLTLVNSLCDLFDCHSSTLSY